MSDDDDTPRRDKRDPILMVGSIVLAFAFIVVISGYAYGELTSEDKEPARYYDRVMVDYVGSYYGYYLNDDGTVNEDAVIFDTSLWSVAKFWDDDGGKYNFSWEFKQREERSYVPFNVTIGSGGALKDFESALLGLMPGDTARVTIEEAYGKLPKLTEWDKTMNMAVTEKMTAAEFRLTFGLDTSIITDYRNILHPYGWYCDATVDNKGYVYVTHLIEDGEEYENGNGSMTAKVSAVTATGFTVKFGFTDEAYTSGDDGVLKLIQFIHGGKTYYIVSEDAGSFYTKPKSGNNSEITGETLYFVITFVAYQ